MTSLSRPFPDHAGPGPGWTALALVLVSLLAGCGDSQETRQTVPTSIADSAPSVPPDGDLSVRLPSNGGLPTASSWETVKHGTGSIAVTGDFVEIDYEMVSWTTGEVVESTKEDFGEPLQVLLGAEDVPAVLEAAIRGTPGGSRIMVVFEPDLADLPSYLDPADAYVLAVDVIGTDG